MVRHLPLAAALLLLLGLGLRSHFQERRIAALETDLAALRDEVAEAERAAAERPFERVRYEPVRPQAPAAPIPAAAPPVQPAAPPRAAVSPDEIARVESAMLNLLESDHPELRAKLRSVVEEQHETLEQEQREQRRERWIARTEARLAEAQGDAALKPEQREAVLTILLGTRDQIGDLRRSAETPEAWQSARETARKLRIEADAKIRELLTPAQYEAYKERFDRDDDDDDRRRPERRGN